MLKQFLLIGAAAVSIPALAQTTQPTGDSANPPTTMEPTAPAPMPDTTAPAPAPDASTPPAASEAAPSGTAATPAQIAQIVDREFPTYDGDGNGDLNEAEFAAWMKKLRAATDPSADPESAAVKAWIGQAHAAADADRSGAVSKAELTAFLSRGN
ncbi:calcium-binding protein [Sphingopyxis alaskensis]|uniref:Calcium-binding EF-hand n=1 Tax=Sphingopyxis alaskensis (strain DSM 13593 / LMG 18877 / RB2256) TaxID=317655 RepID=Q1GU86_SPHAL|nr:calcium-binding EF-hand [Sphingopyxis alaskensis]ABF52786.1 Calcium-binding EF-hand [Sphingopyxis alaskensis RB2256]MCM3418321.1 calcium-binding protein [Sphingopyxis alaskensis]